ncbi:MAG: flagellar motor protein MotB, partial [Odoribacter sp.]|nr:flagellar motor protein MotB [Odoribacter sp.]
MKKVIYALCLFVTVTSCVSKKKFTLAENGRLAALSRERALNKDLNQLQTENTGLKRQIARLEGDTARLGASVREYRESLYSNMSEQDKLAMMLQEKMSKLAEREATINQLQEEINA